MRSAEDTIGLSPGSRGVHSRPASRHPLPPRLYWATDARIVLLAPPVDGPDIRFAFYIAIGFLAGFSERYAQDMLLVRSTGEATAQTPATGPGANQGPGSGGTDSTGSGKETDQTATA